MRRLLTNPWFAAAVSVALVVIGVGVSVALQPDLLPVLAALPSSVAAGAGGMYTGTMIRRRVGRRC